MLILAMDTAQGACSAALARDGELLAHRFELMRAGHAERLLPQIMEVMEEAAAEMADLTHLAVTVGPGTFTGTRIALSTARGMALALEVPIIGVTTLEAVAAAMEERAGTVRVAAFDAKRGELYLQVFEGESLEPLTEPLCHSHEDAAQVVRGAAGDNRIRIAGTGTGILAGLLPAAELPNVSAHPDAVVIARIAKDRKPAPGPVSPLYLRAPDAKLPGGIDPDPK